MWLVPQRFIFTFPVAVKGYFRMAEKRKKPWFGLK